METESGKRKRKVEMVVKSRSAIHSTQNWKRKIGNGRYDNSTAVYISSSSVRYPREIVFHPYTSYYGRIWMASIE